MLETLVTPNLLKTQALHTDRMSRLAKQKENQAQQAGAGEQELRESISPSQTALPHYVPSVFIEFLGSNFVQVYVIQSSRNHC
ncbi:hypothetical protein UNDYM_4612 [Undibacterium sp. YM2]|uniref:hypothetical protein n=1 Tax=Undibacterium sp. YM2 TaxID=2058625 RepID=UPI001331C9C5|nr:hypothetical protein [Undibacterium sp. YM2]BBB68865.1 hypothetical protein UNDYM_4612 [Undibacterium sp. YM2]